MDSQDPKEQAHSLANSTITALIDLGFMLTLEESFGIKDRIAELLEEDAIRPGRNVLFKPEE